jgi:phage shock protein A
MSQNDLVERLFNGHRNMWIETTGQVILLKAQLDINTEKVAQLEAALLQKDEEITNLKKKIEALRAPKPAPQAQEQIQK